MRVVERERQRDDAREQRAEQREAQGRRVAHLVGSVGEIRGDLGEI